MANARESVRTAIAPLAAASAWGLQDWSHLQQYVQALKPDSADTSFSKRSSQSIQIKWPKEVINW